MWSLNIALSFHFGIIDLKKGPIYKVSFARCIKFDIRSMLPYFLVLCNN